MTDNMTRDQGQKPAPSGQQPEQKQEDASKNNPPHDHQGQHDKQKQQDQGGQRRAS